MNRWQRLLHELPVVVLDFVVWSREVLILLTKIEAGNQENEDSYYEGYEQSQELVTYENSKMLFLSLIESCTNSRYVEKHWYTYLHETFDYTVFLLLNGWHIIWLESTGIKGIAESMYKDDEDDGHTSYPIGVVHSFLSCGLSRRSVRNIGIVVQRTYVATTLSLETTIA